MVQKSAGLRRPILRARRSTPVTGSYTVVLKDEVSEQQFEKILQKATELASEKRLHAILHTVEKSFTARLSPYSLEIVSKRCMRVFLPISVVFFLVSVYFGFSAC